MGFIERELERVRSAIPSAEAPLRDQLMTAQQALSWALDPYTFKGPVETLTGRIPEGSEGCRTEYRRAPSLDMP
jgi:hypothetical protein